MQKKEAVKKEIRPREKTKLSFKEGRELTELPQKIESLEEEKGQLTTKLNDAAFQMKNDAKTINEAISRLDAVENELEEAYLRWEGLEELASKLGAS